MAHFTTDELVAATALMVCGIIHSEGYESPVSPRNHNRNVFQADAGSEEGPSVIERLGLSTGQQHRIRATFEQRREEINVLSEEIERQSEELYRVRFVSCEREEQSLANLATRHVETRLTLKNLHEEMYREIDDILTPAQKLMAARLSHERRHASQATGSKPDSFPTDFIKH